jgi:hypothetical protein
MMERCDDVCIINGVCVCVCVCDYYLELELCDVNTVCACVWCVCDGVCVLLLGAIFRVPV